jgi:alanyl-tRNA synthetase
VVLESKSEASQTEVTVKTDPRVEISQKAIEDRYNFAKKLEHYTSKTTQAVDQLKASKKTLAVYKKRIEQKDKEENKELLKLIEEHSKKIEDILILYIGKEDKRQGIVRNPENSVLKRIYSASRYVRSRPSGITSTEKQLLEHTRQDLQTALDQTNAYYEVNWDAVRTQIEAIDLSEFDTIKRFKLD